MRREGEVRFIGTVSESGEFSELEVYPEFCEGLYRLGDFSHVMIFYWLHLRDNNADRRTLKVVPRRHREAPEVGVFASRSPSRPNPIGFQVVELLQIENCKVLVKGLDAFAGSPLIDIKPYLPRADSKTDVETPKWTLKGPPT